MQTPRWPIKIKGLADTISFFKGQCAVRNLDRLSIDRGRAVPPRSVFWGAGRWTEWEMGKVVYSKALAASTDKQPFRARVRRRQLSG